MNKLIIKLFILTSFYNMNAQQKEYIGVLKIDKNTLISYHLKYIENNGKISGYSITDLNGANETKNKIEGLYNKKNQEISFAEKDIVYSKSIITKNNFCYLQFNGKLTLNTKKISGDFKSIFKNGKSCINGHIELVALAQAQTRIQKINTKIQQTNIVSKTKKDSVNLNKMLEELTLNKITKNQLTTVYWDTDYVIMEIWDPNIEDGDQISITINDQLALKNYGVLNKKKLLRVNLINDINKIKIISNSVGEFSPNTAKITLKNDTKSIDLVTELDENETTTIQFINNKKGG